MFRIKGKGVQFLQGSGRGDHYVHITVHIPTSLTDEQRQLLERFASTEGEEVPGSRGMFDKVKEFLGSGL